VPQMRNHLLQWTLGVSLVGVLTGCGKPVTKSELPGTYVADFGLATDTLAIKPDGQFTQTIRVKADGKMATAAGTWSFAQKDREVHFTEFMVVINGFSEVITNFDDPKKRGPQFAPVRRVSGKLEIGGDDISWGRKGVDAPYTKLSNSSP